MHAPANHEGTHGEPSRTLRRLRSRPATRESRVRFASRPALLRGLARAQREPWLEACHVDWRRLELVIRVGSPAARPSRRPTWLRLVPGGRARA